MGVMVTPLRGTETCGVTDRLCAVGEQLFTVTDTPAPLLPTCKGVTWTLGTPAIISSAHEVKASCMGLEWASGTQEYEIMRMRTKCMDNGLENPCTASCAYCMCMPSRAFQRATLKSWEGPGDKANHDSYMYNGFCMPH